MNKEDLRQMTKSEEQIFASQIEGIPLKEWKPGKEFMAMSVRTAYIFDPTSGDDRYSGTMEGKKLYYVGYESHVNPDLKDECVLKFSDGTAPFAYSTGKSTEEALEEIYSSKLPLLSDLDLIRQWKEKLEGKTLWTKSNLWYDDSGNRKDGLRYAEVKVLDVVPTTGDFPMNVKIVCGVDDYANIRMNYTSDKADSRNFAAVFFLSDPKSRYPNISDENWELIQSGKVGKGMTKDECRLSIGNPDEVQSGHSTSSTLDIWQYSDGTYLLFSDGLLTNFRQ